MQLHASCLQCNSRGIKSLIFLRSPITYMHAGSIICCWCWFHTYYASSIFPNIHDSSWQRVPQNTCRRTWKCMDLIKDLKSWILICIYVWITTVHVLPISHVHFCVCLSTQKNLIILRSASPILYLCNLVTTSFYSRCTPTISSGIL